MGFERFFLSLFKDFLVLYPFFLDPDPCLFCLNPDPYQSSRRICNEFFLILDPDPYQNDTNPSHLSGRPDLMANCLTQPTTNTSVAEPKLFNFVSCSGSTFFLILVRFQLHIQPYITTLKYDFITVGTFEICLNGGRNEFLFILFLAFSK